MNYFFKTRLFLLIYFSILSSASNAEWHTGADFSTYYTDNVSLFSATRRLSVEEDPTQPIVDEPEQRSDFIYEPQAYIKWLTKNQLGELQVSFDAGAYVFQDASEYTHGFFQLEVSQTLAENTRLELIYDYVPDQYIGPKAMVTNQHSHSEHEEAEEKLDSHVWSIQVEHELSEHFMLRGLVRYGIRDYTEPFTYRDTQFFTVGSHLEWIISPNIELLVGYHFERGYTDRSQTKQYNDDIGYINNYASAELIVKLMPKLKMKMAVDYEHNDFTSPHTHDIHFNGNENVYQGELEMLYEINHALTLKAGWQHGTRKLNYESHWVDNNNGWIGAEYHF